MLPLSLLVVFMAAGTAAALPVQFAPNSTWTSGLTTSIRLQRPEGPRFFDIFIPNMVSGDDRPALILDFHSQGLNNAAQRSFSRLQTLGAVSNQTFLVAWVAGYNEGSYNAGYCCGSALSDNVDDVGLVQEVIATIKANVVFNPRKVYAYGFSNGGGLAQFLAYRLNNEIAAVGANSYSFNEWFMEDLWQNYNDTYRPIPAFSIHGYRDGINCWDVCILGVVLDQENAGRYIRGHRGWRNWAQVNGCTGHPVTRAETSNSGLFSLLPFIGDHYDSEYRWIKAYETCHGGAEVVQLLNSGTHAGEWFGRNNLLSQWEYMEMLLEWFIQWSIPDHVPVFEPDWWATTF